MVLLQLSSPQLLLLAFALLSLPPFLAPSLLLARALLLVLVGVALLAPRPRPR